MTSHQLLLAVRAFHAPFGVGIVEGHDSVPSTGETTTETDHRRVVLTDSGTTPGTTSPSSAVVRKIRSSQTIGDE